MKRSFAYCGPKLWNMLPNSLRNNENIDMFKNHLKFESENRIDIANVCCLYEILIIILLVCFKDFRHIYSFNYVHKF